jgi:hypothetical protein
MPYKLHEIGGKYEVMNIGTGKTHGKTTKAKAISQMNLLNAIKHGFKPSKK